MNELNTGRLYPVVPDGTNHCRLTLIAAVHLLLVLVAADERAAIDVKHPWGVGKQFETMYCLKQCTVIIKSAAQRLFLNCSHSIYRTRCAAPTHTQTLSYEQTSGVAQLRNYNRKSINNAIQHNERTNE